MEQRKPIGVEIRMASLMMKRVIDAEVQKVLPEGVTGIQSRIIAYLYDRRERDVFQRDIEAEFAVRRSTASVTLSLMEKNGLILRQSVEHDARLKKITLTERAVSIYHDVKNAIDTVEQRAIAGLDGDEVEELYRVLGKIRSNLKGENGGKLC